MTRPPAWLITGSLGSVPRSSIATIRRLRLPLFFSWARSPSPVDTLDGLACLRFSPGKAGGRNKDVGEPVSSVPVRFQGNRRLSHLPSKPPYCFALFSDPGRTSAPDQSPCRLLGASVWSPLSQARRLHQSLKFRGSIAGLRSSLSTLRADISIDDARLASAGWSGLVGRDWIPAGFDLSISIAGITFSFFFLFVMVPATSQLTELGWRHVIQSAG